MRCFARLFASAVARRVAYVLAALLLSAIGIGGARAQSAGACSSPSDGCSQGDAYVAASAFAGQRGPDICKLVGGSQSTYTGPLIEVDPSNSTAEAKALSVQAKCSIAGPAQVGYKYYLIAKSCSSLSSTTTQFMPPTGSTQCLSGCEMSFRQNGDGETSLRSPTGAACSDGYGKNCPSGSFWNGYMGVCQPIDPPCPEGQVKEDGVCKPENKCPQGMVAVQASTPGAVAQGALYCAPEKEECPPGTIMSPSGKCLPGEGQCAAGEAPGKDGTCKKDADGDGQGDEDGEGDGEGGEGKKDEASGGESCDTPPTCSGNAIQCIQVKIQWRIDCNTRRAQNISGGSCDAVPVCTGKACDAMEYAQLMQQWRSTCALEKLAKGTNASGNSTDKNGNGVADALEGSGNVTDPGDGKSDVDGAKHFGLGVSTSKLDTENIFGNSSCPQPPSFTIRGTTINGADFPYFCQAAAILRALILMYGAYLAIRILMGWGF
ncbi:hypothetical protein KV692_22025 [Xanthomonas euvesicatoria pv. physalidis]|nr:hypothetical protein [Xanthomonas euvesicatoria pv. physalidis]